jgi:hypothetical protein
MKLGIVATLALIVGVVVGSLAMSHTDSKEMAMRAHWARALFRVAERHVGHQQLIAEWREEAQLQDSTFATSPSIPGPAAR